MTRMSGVDIGTHRIRKGATDQIIKFVEENRGTPPTDLQPIVERIARSGGTPLVVADGARALGVIHLKDVVKEGIRERFERLRAMGLRTVMITGDNPLTAAAIAQESGVDDFLAEATPETKLRLIREEQNQGKLVAMIGDGTNDAPALALRGVRYRPVGAAAILTRNLFIYGFGGVIIPFIGIKAIDIMIAALHLA